MASSGRTTYTEAQINERHKQRWAVIAGIYGDKFKVPADVAAKLGEKNRLEWQQFVEERDGKRHAGEPTAIDAFDLGAGLPGAEDSLERQLTGQNGQATPAVDSAAIKSPETQSGSKPIAVVDNENDREVARFATVAEAKAWLAAHPNQDKVERHEYIVVGFEPDGVNPPPEDCAGCGELTDAEDLTTDGEGDNLCPTCTQEEDDLADRRVNMTDEEKAEEVAGWVAAYKLRLGEDPPEAALSLMAEGRWSLDGWIAGQEAGSKAIIIPRDDHSNAAPGTYDDDLIT